MGIEIRPATPDDAAVCAPLMYYSGPEVFNFFVGSKDATDSYTFLELAFRKNAGEFGYAHHLVAELEGQVVGVAIGFGKAEVSEFNKVMIKFLFRYFGILGGIGACFRGMMIELSIKGPGAGEYVVAHIGVNPECRGQGVGSRLLEALYAQGRERGLKNAVLDVAGTNPRAQALYEREGFVVTHTVKGGRSSAHGGIVSHYRMAKPLS